MLLSTAAIAAQAGAEPAYDLAAFDLDLVAHAQSEEAAPVGKADPQMLYRLGLEGPNAAVGPRDGEVSEYEARGLDTRTRLSFGQQVNSIKWELGGAFLYMTAVNMIKLTTRENGVDSFSFYDEGFFGKDTDHLGVDKLTHAHNTHILTDILAARIRKKTGTARGTALTGGVLASGLMFYSEIYDGVKEDKGFGMHDILFNSLGAGFSVLRDTTPGLEEKLDFRTLIIPNEQIYSPAGNEHYDQLRYMFALKPSGFTGLRKTPLRYVEFHVGYYAKGLTDAETGGSRQRKLFAGVGLNISEILFGRRPRSKVGRAGQELLDYWQPPYTYLHVD